MKCDNCGRDLTNKAVRILPKFYDNRNYYVCSRESEDSLVDSRDYYYEFQEAMEREMYEELFGKWFK